VKRALVFAILLLTPQLFAQTKQPCRWYQWRCSEQNEITIEGLPPEAPHSGTVITIDVSKNQAYLFQDGQLVRASKAATGSEKTLVKGEDMWVFHTPRGHLKVLRKIDAPVWRKPDWAFIEAGERVPPRDSPKRYIKGKLGKNALDLGDGILIHGTDDLDSFGRSVSHGCIRLPEQMLETVYNAARVGTDVYIFESQPGQQPRTGEAEAEARQ
jgi:lipoprotein-anchoring transpeptidase ErfK/SrfK